MILKKKSEIYKTKFIKKLKFIHIFSKVSLLLQFVRTSAKYFLQIKGYQYHSHTFCIILLQGKVFVFDKVLKPNVTQEYVYTVTAKPIVAGNFCLLSCCSHLQIIFYRIDDRFCIYFMFYQVIYSYVQFVYLFTNVPWSYDLE